MEDTLQIVNSIIKTWKLHYSNNVENIYTEILKSNMVVVRNISCINTSMLYHIPYKLKIRIVPKGNSVVDMYCKIF